MRYILTIFLLLAIGSIAILSCAKYKDSTAKPDPRITNPYCNDPNAVNYNWGFPGKPDSTVCFYPTDVFKGVYEFHDSISLASNALFIHADTLILTIKRLSNTKFILAGFCPSGGTINMTAGADFSATIDSVIGDTTTLVRGQALCGAPDTIYGTLTKDRLVDTILYINFQVASDSGITTLHTGTAILKHK